MSVSYGRFDVVERSTPPFGRIPPWRWSLWGPWPPDPSIRKPPPTDVAIKARAEELAQCRPWCTDEQNWADASLELISPLLFRWRPSLLRWLGASEKTGWDWMELSLKLSVPVTIALGGWYLGTINDARQNAIAQKNREAEVKRADNSQKDAVIREYIKEMKGMLLNKAVAKEAKQPGSEANGVARALTLTALAQLKGEDPERLNLVFQFLNESNFPIFAGSKDGIRAGMNIRSVRTNLIGYDLRGVDFSQADLSWAFLVRSKLNGANLSGANLRGTYLWSSNLSGADLSRANALSGASLSGANLDEVRWDKNTKWPDKSAFKNAKNIPHELKKQLGLD